MDFAQRHSLGVELLSTGGTCQLLDKAAIPWSRSPPFPEMMDSRVKTLHPGARRYLERRGQDEAVMAEHGIKPIDMVVVNLYPSSKPSQNPAAP